MKFKGLIVFILLLFSLIDIKKTEALTREERGRQFFDYILSKENIPPASVRDPTAAAPVFINLYYNRDLAKANTYLENVNLAGDELAGADLDFPAVFLLRIYFTFKDSGKLTAKAKENLTSNLKTWLNRCRKGSWYDCCNEEECQVLNSENHNIIKYSVYYLVREEFGQRTDLAEAGIDRWISTVLNDGINEFNSPIYTDRALMGLFTLYDFARNLRVKTKARMALDYYFTYYALINLYQSRCGPAIRAYQGTSGDIYVDRSTDGMYEIGYLLLGTGGFPARFHMSSVHNVMTSYKLPKALYNLAVQMDERDSYEVKTRGWLKNDIYYYVSPSFTLGTIQGLEVPSVPEKTEIWSACFKDSPQSIIFSNNSLAQYKNTIFFDSRYNFHTFQAQGDNEAGWFFFKGSSYYGAQKTNLILFSDQWSQRNVSILEIRESKDFSSFEEFKNKIKNNQPIINQKTISYTNTFGEIIFLDLNTKTVKVNNNSLALNNYPLFESTYVNSSFKSGLINISYKGETCVLDFRNLTNPVFSGCQVLSGDPSLPVYTPEPTRGVTSVPTEPANNTPVPTITLPDVNLKKGMNLINWKNEWGELDFSSTALNFFAVSVREAGYFWTSFLKPSTLGLFKFLPGKKYWIKN